MRSPEPGKNEASSRPAGRPSNGSSAAGVGAGAAISGSRGVTVGSRARGASAPTDGVSASLLAREQQQPGRAVRQRRVACGRERLLSCGERSGQDRHQGRGRAQGSSAVRGRIRPHRPSRSGCPRSRWLPRRLAETPGQQDRMPEGLGLHERRLAPRRRPRVRPAGYRADRARGPARP